MSSIMGSKQRCSLSPLRVLVLVMSIVTVTSSAAGEDFHHSRGHHSRNVKKIHVADDLRRNTADNRRNPPTFMGDIDVNYHHRRRGSTIRDEDAELLTVRNFDGNIVKPVKKNHLKNAYNRNKKFSHQLRSRINSAGFRNHSPSGDDSLQITHQNTARNFVDNQMTKIENHENEVLNHRAAASKPQNGAPNSQNGVPGSSNIGQPNAIDSRTTTTSIDGTDGLVRRKWGVSDHEAVAGEIFKMELSKDAFSGPVQRYTMSNLPPWLVFSPPSSVVGVAPRPLVGRQVYLSVTAHGPVSVARDTFAVGVVKRRRGSPCPPLAPPLLLSVVVPATVDPRAAVTAVEALAELTALDTAKFTLSPAAPSDPLDDPSALEAARLMDDTQLGAHKTGAWTRIQAVTGCGVSLLQAGSSIQSLQEAGDGLPDLLGLPVVGWTLGSTDRSPSHHRGRRSPQKEAEYDPNAATYDDSYDYYDYNNLEYDDYDPNEPFSGGYYEEELPDERVVPSLATPVYSGTNAGPSAGPSVVLPPILRPVPISTPVNVPIKPTRVVVHPSPTLAPPLQPTAMPTDPTPPHHSILVEPSHAPTHLIQPSTVSLLPTPATATISTPPIPPRTTPPASLTTPSPPSPHHQVTDHLVRNFAPKVLRRIDKLAWVAGFVYRMKIHNDTFADTEDGYTRDLRLMLTNDDGTQLGPQSWIQFDSVNQEIYALPLEDLMGYHTFLLEAIDSGGVSVTESVKIHIEQPKEARLYNHRYAATMRIAKKYEYEFVNTLDWQIRAVQKVASLFDNNTSSLNIRSISDNPTKVVWTNVSLVDQSANSCPDDKLDYLNTVLFGSSHNTGHLPTRDVEDAFKPEFHIKRIHVHYYGHCEDYPRRPSTASPIATTPRNVAPHFFNQIDIINATAGALYRWQVPKDACYDSEDGPGRNLRLRLLTFDLKRVPLDSWVQFDSNNQEFYGLPLDDDIGSQEYTLECVDRSGGKTVDALNVVVHGNPHHKAGTTPPPATFSVTLDHDYSALMNHPHDKMMLVTRLGTAFGDPHGRLVSVSGIEPTTNNGKRELTISWYNASLHGSHCPSDSIQALHDIMYTSVDSIRASFADHFLPEFVITDGNIRPGGSCLGRDTPRHDVGGDRPGEDVFGFDDVHDDTSGSSLSPKSEDYLLTFLVPSVLMAAMLVLAAVAACCLYRHRRRYAKMSLTSHTSPGNDTTTFVTTGIPVILAEELDDHPNTLGSRGPQAKTPVIMKEEKPPLPPYRQSPPPSAHPTGPRAHHTPGGNQPPYQQPPPPFTTNGRNSPRSNASQPPAYRKPTYMPP